MSSGSDIQTPRLPPSGGIVSLDDVLPEGDTSPSAGNPLDEFVRPSAIAREAISLPEGLPRGETDASAVVERVMARLGCADAS